MKALKHVWIRSLTLTAVSVCIVALSTGGVQLYTDEQKMDSYTRLEAGALLEEIDHMAASGETETSDDILSGKGRPFYGCESAGGTGKRKVPNAYQSGYAAAQQLYE